MKPRVCILLLVVAATAFAFLKAYEVTPVKPGWSQWADGGPSFGVGQWITASLDSVAQAA